MPLSDREQQLLDQLEQQLHAEDPAFARSLDGGLSGSRGSLSGRRLALGILVALLGLATVLAGVGTKLVLLGFLGFVLMGGGVLLAIRRGQPAEGRSSARSSERKRTAGTRPSFMMRLEERWEDRRGGI